MRALRSLLSSPETRQRARDASDQETQIVAADSAISDGTPSNPVSNDRSLDSNRAKPEPGSRSWRRLGRRSHGTTTKQDDLRGPTGLRIVSTSPRPLVDLIFVHGLRGGSIKTWRKGEDPNRFWPQSWLPQEPGLENVNIHSFGYDSDWASPERSILDVHAFGQNLLEEMRNSHHLREKGERPIVLVGHSMGGLVIKKAFILSRAVPDFSTRIRCIFFLATPHRGSDYAAILNNILSISGILSSRQYITELKKGSASLEALNEEFGKYAHDLPIFSFFETLRTSLGVSSVLIVNKSSAILGHAYKGERVQYINANHRDICKYDHPNDPNYLTVKNALAGAVTDLLRDESGEQLRDLRGFLGVYDGLSEQPQHQRAEETCEWLDAREDFRSWRDGHKTGKEMDNDNLSIFWVQAPPGSGKTVLASHVISQLQDSGVACASYHFHVGTKGFSSVGSFLRSIAYQMAASNTAIRMRLFQLLQEGLVVNVDEPTAIWNTVFRKGIFKTQLSETQYWVVDALDECERYQGLLSLLNGEKPNFPLRILVTSRAVAEMQRWQQTIGKSARVVSLDIPLQATLQDIHCFVASRIASLPGEDKAHREQLAQTIIDRSNASFLWARLVMDELENVYTYERVAEVLERIPQGMAAYYERSIGTMAKNADRHVAKAVLTWTAMASRKLTLSELSQALKFDLNIVLPNTKRAIEGLCGQLVSIDQNSDTIGLLHPTCREFLLSEAAGEFSISEPLAHEMIAMVCLRLLTSNEMRPPRNRRFLEEQRPPSSPMLHYALVHFSGHVAEASPGSSNLLAAVDGFLKTHVLSWIERLAMGGNLHSITRASRNLSSYIGRTVKHRGPPMDDIENNISSWAVDLGRLVTHFGEALLQRPSVIYFQVPPLCPVNSAINRQFGNAAGSLQVLGKRKDTWDDRISFIAFGDKRPTAISCGGGLIAVAMWFGEMVLYDDRSGQKQGAFRYGKSVDKIHVVDGGVASCSWDSVKLQDFNGGVIWEHESPMNSQWLYLESWRESIFAVSTSGHLLQWDRLSGDLLGDQAFPYKSHQSSNPPPGNMLSHRVPSLAAVSPDMEVLALAYRGGSVCLWDIRTHKFVDWAQDGRNWEPKMMLFNANPDISLLLVIYEDHQMTLFDSWSGALVKTRALPQLVGVVSASCSPDGRRLVTADNVRNIRIWDFESLSLLYHVVSESSGSMLSFTSDGARISDVIRGGMRIWSPPLLEADLAADHSGADCADHDGINFETTVLKEESAKSVVLSAHPTLPLVVAGRDNGQVIAFSTGHEADNTTALYSHTEGTYVRMVAVSTNHVVASCDGLNTLQVWAIDASFTKANTLLFETHITGHIQQLCFSSNGEYLLVATAVSDSVYQVQGGVRMGLQTFETKERELWRWLVWPPMQPDGEGNRQTFSLLADGVLRSYDAQEFPKLVHEMGIRLDYSLQEGQRATHYDSTMVGNQSLLALEVRHYGKGPPSTVFLFDLGKSTPESPTVTLYPEHSALSRHFQHFLGFGGSEEMMGAQSMVFLHQNSWICSINLSPGDRQEYHYKKHFFMPDDYLSNRVGDLFWTWPVKTAGGDIVFSLGKELSWVRNGMTF
ncbi:NACHT and WD domain protein [Chaetomium tenue]|uniref:NACHT and WD domain protein n=1 Tax=Chaetomium tenue TaxID=1854479 RepID=A0ACB7PQX9_9PEZI|nr:NACHT and WD domain protein [Chaetomium globosum]